MQALSSLPSPSRCSQLCQQRIAALLVRLQFNVAIIARAFSTSLKESYAETEHGGELCVMFVGACQESLSHDGSPGCVLSIPDT